MCYKMDKNVYDSTSKYVLITEQLLYHKRTIFYFYQTIINS